MKAWMRLLTITLSNSKKKLVFGDNDEATSFNFDISISGSKYISSLKDSCTVNISNLPYETVVQIIKGNYYDVEIKCGYKSFGMITVFKGEVLYISNILENDRTHTVVILCASKLLAKFGQSRLNLSLNGGINVYTALKYISKKAGIKAENISNSLRKSFVSNNQNANETAANWIDKFTTENDKFIVDSNGIDNETFSIFDCSKTNKRIINIDESFINLDGGFPKLTTEGLNFSVMPTFSFACGDTIKIDNSLIDISITDSGSIQNNLGYYLDKEGYYMIFEIRYNLQNHGQQFTMELKCKSRSLMSNLVNVI